MSVMPNGLADGVGQAGSSEGVINDAQDLLVIQDIMDTMDQIPPELTRVHSDLNELGAVLYSTLVGLEKNLNKLIDMIQDTTVEPAARFELLQSIAEEAARYKLGGDDKIRVAGGACDGIMAHQKHISNLLKSSTLLNQGPQSPYSRALTLSHYPTHTSRGRGQLARAVNSPFGVATGVGPGIKQGATAAPEGSVRDTPSKKKKSRVQALGREDDDASSVGGEKKKNPKKRRPRATSPADSIASTSAFTGTKPMQPQTARQLAAAANKARFADKNAVDSDQDSADDGKEGPDAASREGSHVGGGRSVNATPTLANATVMPSGSRSRNGNGNGGRSGKRSRDEEEEESMDGEDSVVAGGNGKRGSIAKASDARQGSLDMDLDRDGGGVDTETDTRLYCTCRQVSYGEMIGCDDDNCEIEWYHLACIGLDKTPEGNWICPQCVERRKKNPARKRSGKTQPRKRAPGA